MTLISGLFYTQVAQDALTPLKSSVSDLPSLSSISLTSQLKKNKVKLEVNEWTCLQGEGMSVPKRS